MATSYINERSAELTLVPYLKKELEKYFEYVVPVVPWLNREASKLSRDVHSQDQFKILGLFPRRPKLTEANNKKIYVTINHDLLVFKQFAEEYMVPVIAGCPVASNFWELSICKRFVWLNITEEKVDNYVNLISCDFGKKPMEELSISEIVELVNSSELFNIDSLSEFLNVAKYAMPRRFLFGPKYRPVYFLIK